MFQSFSSPKRFWFAFTHFGLLQCFMLRIIFMFSGLLSHFSVCITFSYFQILRFTFRLFLVCFIQPVLLAFTVFGTFRCSGLLSDCSWKALWTWHTLWHLMVTGVSTSFLDTGVGPPVRQLMTSECLSLTWYVCVFCMLLLSLSLKHILKSIPGFISSWGVWPSSWLMCQNHCTHYVCACVCVCVPMLVQKYSLNLMYLLFVDGLVFAV